jgi:hypothetical protein
MAQTQTPFGMLARWHPSGQARGNQYENVLLSGQTPAIYFGTPVMLAVGQNSATPQVAGSNVQAVTATVPTGAIVVVPVHANTDPILGVFDGVEYTDVNGRRQYSKFWTSALTTYPGTYVIAYIWDDPEVIYEVQLDGQLFSGTYNQVIGRQTNLNSADLGAGTAPAGNAVPIGQSSQRASATLVTANGTTIGTSNTGQLVIVQAPDFNNVPSTAGGSGQGNLTDPFPSVFVKINKHQQKSPFGVPASV